MLLQICE